MRTKPTIIHSVSARNLSATSDNKIHDDNMARCLGFEGGLVAGVEIYAYLTNLPIQNFGSQWLSKGTGECRFEKPVYHGKKLSALGQPEADGSLTMKAESEDVICSIGHAALDNENSAPQIDNFPAAALPDYETRPGASPVSLVPGRILGTFEQTMDETLLRQYLDDIEENLSLYNGERIVHPGWLLRLANKSLSMNVKLGPWIHVGSKITNYSVAHYGDFVQSRAKVARHYEHKRHRFVELDVLLVANKNCALTNIYHTVIYRPRQFFDC